ncbi:hypothetical protein [Pontixanthobacter aquaemixtae]|uniref:DUF1648 domain-containing protein n=1 Tax=Pontixanthobacter aquaemixtae TaxID=1958940 RepID=A0A844ZV62_9SPHN|nr:hypothetical protein [Pontixanthobacter aquaemixtae]MXO89429.1 hypothetical protein [Pontixanthobacter aquaemixtae]
MAVGVGPSTASLAVAVASILLLLLSGWWTNSTYARFDKLPAHYDWKGRATRMERRAVMAWLLPVMFSIILVTMIVLLIALSPDMVNGDPSVGLYLVSATLLASQASVLWMLSRWAKSRI